MVLLDLMFLYFQLFGLFIFIFHFSETTMTTLRICWHLLHFLLLVLNSWLVFQIVAFICFKHTVSLLFQVCWTLHGPRSCGEDRHPASGRAHWAASHSRGGSVDSPCGLWSLSINSFTRWDGGSCSKGSRNMKQYRQSPVARPHPFAHCPRRLWRRGISPIQIQMVKTLIFEHICVCDLQKVWMCVVWRPWMTRSFTLMLWINSCVCISWSPLSIPSCVECWAASLSLQVPFALFIHWNCGCEPWDCDGHETQKDTLSCERVKREATK